MTTISLQDIKLRPSQLKAIERKARDEGVSPPEFVRQLIERELLAEKSFDEILKPIREDVRKSGLTEAQLDAIVSRARRAGGRKARK